MSFGNFFVAVIVQLESKRLWYAQRVMHQDELVDVIHDCWQNDKTVEVAVDLVLRDEEIHGVPPLGQKHVALQAGS